MIRDLNYLIVGLDGGLKNLYRRENLFPVAKNLVRDRAYNLEFHARMPISEVGDGFEFAMPMDSCHHIYDAERNKFNYLARKFVAGGRQ